MKLWRVFNRPTVAGLALYLGFASRQSIYDLRAKNDTFAYIVESAIRYMSLKEHENKIATVANMCCMKKCTVKRTIINTINDAGIP